MPRMASAPHALLDAIAGALAHNLGASMQEIADSAGVSRTTLHRTFANRQALTEALAEHALAESNRVFDEAGIDDRPVAEAFEHLSASVIPLAVAYCLLWAEPPISQTPALAEAVEVQDDRFERFFARGQAEGYFRADLAPRWLVYSIGSQAMAAWFAVRAGFVGAREAPRLFRSTVLSGVVADTSDTGSRP